MRIRLTVLTALLFGDVAATAGTGWRCNMMLQGDQLRFEREPFQAVLERMSAGDCIAYAIALDAPPVFRMVTLATLPMRLRLVERMMTSGGAQVIGRYGVDPTLEAPSCIYELNSAASGYADRCLRRRGPARVLRRILARWFVCDPALGGVVVVGRKG